MKTKNYLIVGLLALLIFTSCSPKSEETKTTKSYQPIEAQTSAYNYQEVSADWSIENSTIVTLSDSGTTAEGEGVKVTGSTVTISSGGTYLISGSLSDGQIVVTAPKTTQVHIVLNGVDITSSTNAAIYIAQADEAVVTLAEGSTNTLTDATSYTYADTTNEEPDAALFSKVDLVITGKGSLVVNGNFNNGIGSKDDLVIESGSITVSAPNHGVRGRDSLTVLDGNLDVTAGSDGLQSNNDEDVSKGWIAIEGGNFNINSAHDGIQAETKLSISGGDFEILSGDGVSGMGITTDDSDSFKGIKSTGNMSITGGSFKIDSYDDSVHSNSNIDIANAEMILSTADDGIHADGELTINSGTIDIITSYEGLEASVMTILGGVVNVVSEDDGINVAGGTDDTETEVQASPKGFGADTFSSNSNRWLYIKGGNIIVDAKGDGIDVNGNAEISGGTVYVNGPTNSGNGGLDYDGTFEISDGVLVVAGSDGMALAPSESSTQPSLMVFFSAEQQANAKVELLDSSGALVAGHTPNKAFKSIVFSAPQLVDGQEYTLQVDGTKLVTTTLSGSVTSITDTGEARAATGGFGGGGMGGGRPADFAGERPASPATGTPTVEPPTA